MSLMARKDSDGEWEIAPEGTQQGVCVEVVDLGRHPNTFKPGTTQHKVLIVWQSEAQRSDGARHLLRKRYTLSLDDRAVLRHDLESWRGKHFTGAELDGFDVLTVIGANALLNVIHQKNQTTGRIYAVVASVSGLVKNMPKMTAESYIRPKYIAGWIASDESAEEPTREQPDERPLTDDDIPF